jgi:hypothetical protein
VISAEMIASIYHWRHEQQSVRASLEAINNEPPDNRLDKFSAGMSRSPGRLAVSMGKVLLSGGLIGYLLYHYGPGYGRLESIDPVLCVVAVATFVLQIALSTLRWGLILTYITGTKPPYYSLFGIYYASTFFSQILPSVGGDLVRGPIAE